MKAYSTVAFVTPNANFTETAYGWFQLSVTRDHTGSSPRLFNSIHTQEGQSYSDPAKATSSGIYPSGTGARQWVNLLHWAGSLLEVLFLALRQRPPYNILIAVFLFLEPLFPELLGTG